MGRHSVPEPRVPLDDDLRERLLAPERWDWEYESGDLGSRSLPAHRLPAPALGPGERYRARRRLDEYAESAR